ncbi:MAG: TonB family protein [Pseudomonadota bacterium]|nr:TonB family protein [Pseudomonadota bacterium]
MSYATTANSPKPAAILGALAVPAGFGALLVAGLAVTAVIVKDDSRLTGETITPVDIPPPPPEKVVEPEPTPQTSRPTIEQPQIAPPPPTPVIFDPGPSQPIDPFATLGDDITTVLPSGLGTEIVPPPAPPTPSVDPVRASPRGNPGRWVTTGDYRARWINEGLTGIASFTLQIDAKGRVSDCRITGSTGHSVLDAATCRLLERRARFTPARDGNGDKVAGSYSSSVSWEIPE